jgi:hypothetical protein
VIKHSGKDGTRLYAGPLASQKKSFPAYQCQSAQYAKPSGGERYRGLHHRVVIERHRNWL